jgi:hypothetical protein
MILKLPRGWHGSTLIKSRRVRFCPESEFPNQKKLVERETTLMIATTRNRHERRGSAAGGEAHAAPGKSWGSSEIASPSRAVRCRHRRPACGACGVARSRRAGIRHLVAQPLWEASQRYNPAPESADASGRTRYNLRRDLPKLHFMREKCLRPERTHHGSFVGRAFPRFADTT